MSKEAIVDKIISDAEIRANSFIEEQTKKADEILAEAAEQCKNYFYAFKAETDTICADIESRAKTVAELDSRKILLATKTKVLDGVFQRALEKLKKLPANECKDLFKAMLRQVAEDGDTVTLGKAQSEVLDENDVLEIAREKGVSLKLSKSFGDFDGMVLSGGGVDKNLTFEVEVDMLREEFETQIAKEIFG